MPASSSGWHNAAMYLFTPDRVAQEREHAHWHPERETMLLAAAGAALVLGERHSATKAFSKAAASMDKVDLWRARLAMKTLSKERRAAIAAADIVIQALRNVMLTR